MNIFRWTWTWGRKTAPVETSSLPPDGKHDLKTKCPSCGYEGDESEFLTEDPEDTICPRCGEDTPIYEM